MRFMNLTSQGGHVLWGLVCWAGSSEWGTWWFGLGRWRLILKAPWNEPLFSERYGYCTYIRLGAGWRIRSRLVP